MPSSFSGFGLKAKHHPSGVIRPQRFIVPASDITGTPAQWDNLFQDDAIYFDTNGRLRLTASATGTGVAPCVGSFQGVEFADSNGRRTVSNQFNKTTIYNAVANSGLGGISDVWFWLYTDPDLIYEVQVAGAPTAASGAPSGGFSPTTPNFAFEGNTLGYSQNTAAANAVTGFSQGFAFAPATATQGSPFIVYNLAYDFQPSNVYGTGQPTSISGNTWGDAYPNVLVRLAAPQFGSTLPQF